MDHIYVSILSFSILAISIILYIKSLFKPAQKYPPLPPGPRGIPILGYLPFLSNNLLQQFTDLGHKYGPIYKLRLGNKLCVVISSPSLVKEVVRDHDSNFANRDVPVAAFVGTYGGKDIAWSKPDSEWRLLRKVFVREMMSRNNLEASYSLRKDEVRKTIRHVHGKIGKPVDIGELTFRTELNVIINMMWGGTIAGDESERVGAEFRTLINKFVDLFGKPNISDFYPGLARFDIQGVKKEMESHVQSLDDIFSAVIAKHENKVFGEIKNDGEKDFVQILLELKENKDADMSITHTQIKAILLDVVVAGTDTTATTAEWLMAELMNNPKVMAKAQKELSDVVGTKHIMEEFHIPKLKYLEAVIKETFRLHPALPLLLPRSPTRSFTIGGYTIPKDTRVLINAASVQKDPTLWDNPTQFKPERFLDNNEKWDLKGNDFRYLPFGSGRRVCPGMPLAERMLMYLIGSLVHSFEWKLVEGETLDMSERFAIILRKRTPLLAIPSPKLFDSDLYV